MSLYGTQELPKKDRPSCHGHGSNGKQESVDCRKQPPAQQIQRYGAEMNSDNVTKPVTSDRFVAQERVYSPEGARFISLEEHIAAHNRRLNRNSRTSENLRIAIAALANHDSEQAPEMSQMA